MSERLVVTRLRAEVDQYKRDMLGAAATTASSAAIIKRSGNEAGAGFDALEAKSKKIDSVSGRLGLLAHAIAILGPSAVSAGAVGGAGLAGLAASAGSAAAAVGVLIGVFQGFGDALSAVDKARLQPTAENIAAARVELQKLAPATRQAVLAVRDLKPALKDIRDAGAGEFFPGFTAGIDTIARTRTDDLERISAAMGGALGDMFADAGGALSSGEWDEFFTYLATDGVSTVRDLGGSIGSLTTGLADLMVAADPLTDWMTGGLATGAAGFAEWASAVDDTQGFQDFVAYVQDVGPQVGSAVASIGDAFLQIAEAAAPLGGPVLAMLESFANIISSIADSDLGTPIMAGVMALSAYNRAMAVTQSLQASPAGQMLSGVMASGQGLMSRVGAAGAAAVTAGAAGGSQAPDFASRVTDYLATTTATSTHVDTSETEADVEGLSESLNEFTEGAGEAARESSGLRSKLGGIAKAGAPLAAMALQSSGVADSMGLANTATLALMGSVAGPMGAAVGAGAGLLMDLAGGFGSSAKEAELAEASTQRVTAATQEYASTLMESGEAGAQSASWLYQAFGEAEGMIAAAGGSLEAFVNQVTEGRSASSALQDQLGMTADQMDWLRGMAASGEDVLSDMFDEYAESVGMTSDELRVMLDATEAVDAATESAADAAEAKAKADKHMADSMSQAEKAAERLEGRLKNLDDFLNQRSGIRAYEASLDNLQAIIGRGNWDVGTERGRENVETLDKAAQDAISHFTDLKDAGKEVAATKFLSRAMADLENFGRKTPAAKSQVEGLLRQLRGVDREFLASLGITGDLTAMQKVRAVQQAIDNMRGTTLEINVIRRTYAAQVTGKRKDMAGMATGGLVSGPGTGTSDDVPIWASNGEYMQQYAAVQHYGVGFMEAVNQRTFPKPQGYAKGGQIGQKTRQGTARYESVEVSMQTPRTEKVVAALERALESATKALDLNSDKLQEVVSASDTLKTSIVEMSTRDLFDGGDGKKKQGSTQILQGDIRNLKNLNRWQNRLDDVLQGDALEAVMGSGLKNIKSMAGWSDKGLERWQRLFNQRQRLADQQAGGIANDVYGQRIRDSRDRVRDSRGKVRDRERDLKTQQTAFSKDFKFEYKVDFNSEFELMPKKFIKPWEKLTRAVEDSRESVSANSGRLSELTSSQASLRSSIISMYTSPLFQATADAWRSPVDGSTQVLQDDVRSLEQLRVGQNRLDDVLTGDALAAVMGGGLEVVQGMAAWSDAELANWQKLFNERAALAQAQGNNIANDAYGPMIAAQEKATAAAEKRAVRMERRLERFEERVDSWPERMGRALSKSAASGTRKSRKGGRS